MTMPEPGLIGKLSATLKAAVSVVPVKSHSTLTVLAIIGAVLAWFSYQLAMNGKGVEAAVAASVVAIYFVLVFIAFFVTHKDQDREGAAPLILETGSGGPKLQVDIRSIDDLQNAKDLLAVIQLALCRQPLPTPHALVGPDMEPVAGTGDQAAAAAAATNEHARQLASVAADLGLPPAPPPLEGSGLLQPIGASIPHSTQEPAPPPPAEQA